MPNWVFNDNVFYSTNKKKIKDFHKKLNEWASRPAMEYEGLVGFNASRWLGNILTSAGFPYHEVEKGLHGRCRGEVIGITRVQEEILDGKTYSFFIVSTITAWERMQLMWINILKKHYGVQSDIKLAFTSAEEFTDFFEVYNPDNMLRLIDYTGEEKYAISKYLELPNSLDFDELDDKMQKLLSYLPEDDESPVTQKEAADILGNILGQKISPEELDEHLDEYVDKCNKDVLFELEAIEINAGINFVPIDFIENLDHEI